MAHIAVLSVLALRGREWEWGRGTDMAPHALQYAAGVASVAMLPVSTYCAMQFAFEFAAQPETDANEV